MKHECTGEMHKIFALLKAGEKVCKNGLYAAIVKTKDYQKFVVAEKKKRERFSKECERFLDIAFHGSIQAAKLARYKAQRTFKKKHGNRFTKTEK